MDWQNKRVLVTGGTSGLGLALVRGLRERGARVAHVSRRTGAVGWIGGDVGQKSDVHRIHAEAQAHLGGDVEVLINNASALGPTPLRLLLDTDCEDLTSVLETNILGPFRLTKLVLPSMILRGEGLILNISSDAAVSAYPRWGAYGISKAALDHLTRVFQAELANTGVRLLALDPGDMDTPMHLAAVPDADRASLHSPEDSARLILEQADQREPLRRSLR